MARRAVTMADEHGRSRANAIADAIADRARAPWLPMALTMGVSPSEPGAEAGDHHHVHDELCLVTGSATTMIHAGVEREAAPGTLFLHRGGEHHGFSNGRDQRPTFWVLHFWPDPRLHGDCPALAHADAARRVLRLDRRREREFRALFSRLQVELYSRHAGAFAANSAFLRLMLIAIARWAEDAGEQTCPPPLPAADPEVMRLWQALGVLVEATDDLPAALRQRVPNYDSLRHRFRTVFKASPREVLMSMRMQRARHLLLETGLPISAIAGRLGYARQHEFTRAFHREVGCTPTAWREHRGSGG